MEYEQIIKKADIKKIIDASNDLKYPDSFNASEFTTLYEGSVEVINAIFLNQLFNRKTGMLNSNLPEGDMKTLKKIFSYFIAKQKNEWTIYDYFDYNFKDDVDGASVEVEAYSPEDLFAMMGITLRTMIQSMDFYQYVINGNAAFLLESDPDFFVTKDEWLEWIKTDFVPLKAQSDQNKKDIAELEKGGVAQSEYDQHIEDSDAKFENRYTKEETDNKIDKKVDISKTITEDEMIISREVNGKKTGIKVYGEGKDGMLEFSVGNVRTLTIEDKQFVSRVPLNMLTNKIIHLADGTESDHAATLGQVSILDQVLSERLDKNELVDAQQQAEINLILGAETASSDGLVLSFHTEPQKIVGDTTMTATMWWTKDPSVLYQSTDKKWIIQAGNINADTIIRGTFETDETAEDVFSMRAILDGKYSEEAKIIGKGRKKEFFFKVVKSYDDEKHVVQFRLTTKNGTPYTISDLKIIFEVVQEGSGSGVEYNWKPYIDDQDRAILDLMTKNFGIVQGYVQGNMDDIKKLEAKDIALETGKMDAFLGTETRWNTDTYWANNPGGLFPTDFYSGALKTQQKRGVGAINELVDTKVEIGFSTTPKEFIESKVEIIDSNDIVYGDGEDENFQTKTEKGTIEVEFSNGPLNYKMKTFGKNYFYSGHDANGEHIKLKIYKSEMITNTTINDNKIIRGRIMEEYFPLGYGDGTEKPFLSIMHNDFTRTSSVQFRGEYASDFDIATRHNVDDGRIKTLVDIYKLMGIDITLEEIVRKVLSEEHANTEISKLINKITKEKEEKDEKTMN